MLCVCTCGDSVHSILFTELSVVLSRQRWKVREPFYSVMMNILTQSERIYMEDHELYFCDLVCGLWLNHKPNHKPIGWYVSLTDSYQFLTLSSVSCCFSSGAE